MLYCAVDEAFDNPLSQQIKVIEKEQLREKHKNELENNVHQFYNNNNIQSTTDFNNNISQYPQINEQPIFNAQGDYEENEINYEGTKISDIEQKYNLNDETLSFLDSEETYKPPKKSHNYYIRKFMNSITEDGSDIISRTSSQDGEIYDHLKKCKYCRTQINNKLKNYYKKDIVVKTENKKIEPKNNNTDILFGYNLKEIIIILIVGICIILLLDIFVKIGRKTFN